MMTEQDCIDEWHAGVSATILWIEPGLENYIKEGMEHYVTERMKVDSTSESAMAVALNTLCNLPEVLSMDIDHKGQGRDYSLNAMDHDAPHDALNWEHNGIISDENGKVSWSGRLSLNGATRTALNTEYINLSRGWDEKLPSYTGNLSELIANATAFIGGPRPRRHIRHIIAQSMISSLIVYCCKFKQLGDDEHLQVGAGLLEEFAHAMDWVGHSAEFIGLLQDNMPFDVNSDTRDLIFHAGEARMALVNAERNLFVGPAAINLGVGVNLDLGVDTDVRSILRYQAYMAPCVRIGINRLIGESLANFVNSRTIYGDSRAWENLGDIGVRIISFLLGVGWELTTYADDANECL